MQLLETAGHTLTVPAGYDNPAAACIGDTMQPWIRSGAYSRPNRYG